MSNFYQSVIRQDVNQYVYGKPFFEVDVFGKKYFGTVKKKSKFGISLNWFQIMGIEFGDMLLNINYINEQLKKIKVDYKKSFGDIFFQFGVVDELTNFPMKDLENEIFVENIKKLRLENNIKFKNSFELLPSFRENMPLATVVFDLKLDDENLRKSISKSARNHINKAKSRGLSFSLIEKEDEWFEFYDIWYQTSKVKGFNIINKQTFLKLKDYIISNSCGNLFLAKKDGHIVSGSLCFFNGKNIIYMYGATNRDFGNVGGHQFLKFEMFKWGRENNFLTADLLGVSPTGFKGHHLDGVTSFKQSLGGYKIEYIGNYDLVFNKLLYNIFKLSKNH